MRMAVVIYVTGISTPDLHPESPPLLGTLTAAGQTIACPILMGGVG